MLPPPEAPPAACRGLQTEASMSVRGERSAQSRPATPVRAAVPDVATFPRPVGTFVGREEELGRVRELAEREVLFLVYGVGGIGKTELGYKAIEELRKREPWSTREPVLLRAE